MPSLSSGLRPLLQTLLMISLIWTAGFLAWGSLREVNFGYAQLYDAMDIGATITRYGPENRYKHGFETTDRQQRLAIFAAIVDAVQDHGRGLDTIRYTPAHGPSQIFLRLPEQIHLRSVARMIDHLRRASYIALGILLVSLVLMRRQGVPMPRASRVLLWGGVVVVVGTGAVMAIGPEKVFYAWHRWAFPAGEQWYFYYQESLMTTLMKAPDLFGGIALLLLAAAGVWFGLLLLGARRLLASR